MINVGDTIISQYANSPILLAIINNLDANLDPRVNLDDFYNNVWNLETAQGWGLDVWGRIVGVPRVLKVPGTIGDSFGFSEGAGYQPFGQAPFYSPNTNYTAITLSDEAYRALIYIKATANISSCSFDALNTLLRLLFSDYGRAYVHSLGDMKMRYVFEFTPTATLLAILQSSNVVPRPSGVQLYMLECVPSSTFGFSGSGLQPFGQGTFFSGEQRVSA